MSISVSDRACSSSSSFRSLVGVPVVWAGGFIGLASNESSVIFASGNGRELNVEGGEITSISDSESS